MNTAEEFSIVAVDKFIQATRDSGYKGTSSAVAELVDNSLQAGATEISVSVTVEEREKTHPVVLSVMAYSRSLAGGGALYEMRTGGQRQGSATSPLLHARLGMMEEERG